MPDPTQGPPPTSGYVVDAENVAEMARLRRQAQMLSEHLGLYPQQLALAQRSHILDIGCGPGEWALEIAQRFPGSRITGMVSVLCSIACSRKPVFSIFSK